MLKRWGDVIFASVVMLLVLGTAVFPGGTWKWKVVMDSYSFGTPTAYEVYNESGSSTPVGAKGHDTTPVIFPSYYYDETVVYLGVEQLGCTSVTFSVKCSLGTGSSDYGEDYARTFTSTGYEFVPITTPCDTVVVSALAYSVSGNNKATVLIGGVGRR